MSRNTSRGKRGTFRGRLVEHGHMRRDAMLSAWSAVEASNLQLETLINNMYTSCL